MVYGVKPDLTREGGSIPVTLTLQEATGKNVILLPMGALSYGAPAPALPYVTPALPAPYAAPAARDAVLTTIKLNPGHATFYRVD